MLNIFGLLKSSSGNIGTNASIAEDKKETCCLSVEAMENEKMEVVPSVDAASQEDIDTAVGATDAKITVADSVDHTKRKHSNGAGVTGEVTNESGSSEEVVSEKKLENNSEETSTTNKHGDDPEALKEKLEGEKSKEVKEEKVGEKKECTNSSNSIGSQSCCNEILANVDNKVDSVTSVPSQKEVETNPANSSDQGSKLVSASTSDAKKSQNKKEVVKKEKKRTAPKSVSDSKALIESKTAADAQAVTTASETKTTNDSKLINEKKTSSDQKASSGEKPARAKSRSKSEGKSTKDSMPGPASQIRGLLTLAENRNRGEAESSSGLRKQLASLQKNVANLKLQVNHWQSSVKDIAKECEVGDEFCKIRDMCSSAERDASKFSTSLADSDEMTTIKASTGSRTNPRGAVSTSQKAPSFSNRVRPNNVKRFRDTKEADGVAGSTQGGDGTKSAANRPASSSHGSVNQQKSKLVQLLTSANKGADERKKGFQKNFGNAQISNGNNNSGSTVNDSSQPNKKNDAKKYSSTKPNPQRPSPAINNYHHPGIRGGGGGVYWVPGGQSGFPRDNHLNRPLQDLPVAVSPAKSSDHPVTRNIRESLRQAHNKETLLKLAEKAESLGLSHEVEMAKKKIEKL